VSDDRRAFFEKFVDLMYGQQDVRTAFDTCVADDYIQHNPGLADGRHAARDALVDKFGDPTFDVTVQRMLVDGDLCALHSRGQRSPPTTIRCSELPCRLSEPPSSR
jgi:predicted SnoaL-like aldol condensation-catalyzing enzyme